MADIFISYKRENQPFAEMLRKHLIEWGYSIWMDVYDIPPGAHWPDAIDAGINSAHTVVGIMSPEAVQSRNVKNEWDWAIVNERRLLLLMLEPCPVPVNYISINYIDASADQATALHRLHGALETPTTPPAIPNDPYLGYLQTLYIRINTILAHAIIKLDDRREPQPIDLVSERTRGAVDELFEKREEIDPFFSAIGIANKQPGWESGDFRAAFDNFEGRVLLLGEPGAGKTITLLHFGRDAIVQRIQNPAAPLPILALIPTWDAREQTPLANWIADSYGSPPNAKQMIDSGHTLLLLDGLDELGNERVIPDTTEHYDPRERFIAALAELPPNQVVVTCRTEDYKSIKAKIALSGAVTLQNLSDAQMQYYLEELPELWNALQSDEGLRAIARTPLLLSFFAFAYRDMGPEDTAQLRDLADSPGDLRDAIFKRYVQERCNHEERKLRQRGEEMLFSIAEINQVLGSVAMENATGGWRSDQREIEQNALEFEDFRSKLTPTKTEKFIELTMQLHLLASGENNTFRFVHLLLRDFFAFSQAISNLAHPVTATRVQAIWALWNLRDRRAAIPLISVLENEALEGRGSAVWALGELRDSRSFEPLVKAMNDRDSSVRSSAAWALGELGDQRAVDTLIKSLLDTDKDVRARSARALGRLRSQTAVEPLISLLNDQYYKVVISAAESLGEIGNPGAILPLIEILDDVEDDVRWRLVPSLSKFGDESFYPLLSALNDENFKISKSAAAALGELGDVRAVEPLINALGNEQSKIRVHIVEALGELKDSRAVKPLIQILKHDKDEDVCEFAILALTRIGTLEALTAVEHWRAQQ